ncbi:dienelactone hydrolase family protein [Specibacter sp. RAF43]|uniref:dienelactone hydrolase family protein n=1 Tax=Specibacter sp. RAF43 TaxID=3233057 RepID=UPI003F9B30C2
MGTMIDFTAAGENFQAYRADPQGPIKGAVVVIHEIWGLVDHIKDVADRFAEAGYVAAAPDLMGLAGLDAVLLADLGAGLADPAARNEIQPRIRAATVPLRSPETAARVQAGVSEVFNYLQETPEGSGRTAVVGFCFGGTYSFALAVGESRLAAAVPFYGHATYDAAELAGIACPVLAFYGEEDKALVEALPTLITTMGEAGVDFTYTVFADAGHAFFNDTSPLAYRPEPAAIAWAQTLEFLGQHLD